MVRRRCRYQKALLDGRHDDVFRSASSGHLRFVPRLLGQLRTKWVLHCRIEVVSRTPSVTPSLHLQSTFKPPFRYIYVFTTTFLLQLIDHPGWAFIQLLLLNRRQLIIVVLVVVSLIRCDVIHLEKFPFSSDFFRYLTLMYVHLFQGVSLLLL